MSNPRVLLVMLLSFVVASSVQAGGTWDPTESPAKFVGKFSQKMMSGKVKGVRAKSNTGRSITHLYARPYDVSEVLPLPAGPWVEVELILADGETTQTVTLDGGLLRIGSLIVGDGVAEDSVLDSGLIQFADELWPADGGAPGFAVSFRVE